MKGHGDWHVFDDWKKVKLAPIFKKNTERTIQVSQPHFGSWENLGESPLGSCFWAHEREGGDWEQSAWIAKVP